MKIYSYSQARQRLATVLNEARREGQVQIRRRDGQVFVVRPAESAASPLDVPGVDTTLTRRDIVQLVRASRRSTERFLKSRPNKLSRPAKMRRQSRRGRDSSPRG